MLAKGAPHTAPGRLTRFVSPVRWHHYHRLMAQGFRLQRHAQSGMSAHCRAWQRCISMQSEQPTASALGVYATTTDEAKALVPRAMPAVISSPFWMFILVRRR